MDPTITAALINLGGPAVFGAAMWILLREQNLSHREDRKEQARVFVEAQDRSLAAFREEMAAERSQCDTNHKLEMQALTETRHEVRQINHVLSTQTAVLRALVEKKLPDVFQNPVPPGLIT